MFINYSYERVHVSDLNEAFFDRLLFTDGLPDDRLQQPDRATAPIIEPTRS